MCIAKKLLIIIVFFLITTFCSAQSYIQQMLSLEEDRNTGNRKEYYEVVIGDKYKNWDFSTCFGTKEGSDNLEHRIKYTMDLIFVEFYLQERLGHQWDDDRDLNYYAFDSGMVVLISDKTRIEFMLRHKNSFDDDDEIQANRVGLELKRTLSKHTAMGVAYMQSYGDKDINTWRFSLTYKF